MIIPALPPDEAARLRALRALNLLDTPAVSASASASPAIEPDEHAVIAMIARGDSLTDVLARLCRAVEQRLPGAACSVLLADEPGERLYHGAAPSLPPSYVQAIDGLSIGPTAGSCGTAAWRGQPVIVDDIARDPLWEAHRAAAAGHGLAACWSTPLQLAGGHVGGTFAVYHRVPHAPTEADAATLEPALRLAEIAIRQERLLAASRRDELTDLPGRGVLARAVDETIERGRGQGMRPGLLAINLDGFRRVNEALGRGAGDRLLRDVAARLSAAVRAPDLLVRTGGDEFALLARRIDEQDLATLAQRLLGTLAAPFLLDGQEVFLSATIGGAVWREHCTGHDGLVRLAEAALRRARRVGPGRFELAHDAPRDSDAPNAVTLEAALRHAIERGELRLAWQPRVHAQNGRIVGVEALLRWQHPALGAVSPARFIPLAEATGLIRPIGHWVLGEACRQATRWRAQGLAPLVVSVNVSARQFTTEFFARSVPEALAEAGLDPWWLELELTETVMMDHADAEAMAALARLRDRGVRVVLDDFGTGYSSLAYLHRFPLDGLKIDRSFVARLPAAADACAIARAVIGLAHGLGLHVVAEGVETAEQRDWLRASGCHEFQGFLFARPEPPEEIARRLADGAAARRPA